MNRRIVIELFEQHEAVRFYTVRFSDQKETEYDKFCQKFDGVPKFSDDFNIIIEWLSTIGEKGASERHFRLEGGKIKALPVAGCKLRLYGIRISDSIFIIGNGDVKRTQKYQNDPVLNRIVNELRQIVRHLDSRVKNGEVQIYNGELYGNLAFTIDTE